MANYYKPKFYKPNKSNKGHLFSFNLGKAKEDENLALYLEGVKQNGWNEETKNGTFKDGAKISVKFNEFEIAQFLNTIETDFAEDLKLYHSFGDSGTQIFFSAKEYQGKIGYVLTVMRKEERFSMAFSKAEVLFLREYFKFVLTQIFSQEEVSKAKKSQTIFD